jgi:hypothetical protein
VNGWSIANHFIHTYNHPPLWSYHPAHSILAFYHFKYPSQRVQIHIEGSVTLYPAMSFLGKLSCELIIHSQPFQSYIQPSFSLVLPSCPLNTIAIANHFSHTPNNPPLWSYHPARFILAFYHFKHPSQRVQIHIEGKATLYPAVRNSAWVALGCEWMIHSQPFHSYV